MSFSSSIQYTRPELPVLAECDALVLGGSFAGVAAALRLARAGRKVMLVEARTYLGREVTAHLQPWADSPSALPEWLRQAGQVQDTGALLFGMDALKTSLEDALLAAGVRLLYASLPVQVLSGPGGAQGVVLGNKSGRQVVRCALLVDATQTALACRLAGAAFQPPAGVETCQVSLLFSGVSLPQATLTVPESLGLLDHQVQQRPGPAHNTVLVTFTKAMPALPPEPGAAALAAARRSAALRAVTIALAEYLVQQAPDYAGAYLAESSHEPRVQGAPGLADPAPDWAAAGRFNWEGQPLCAPAFAGPLRGLWCLSPAARLTPAQRVRLHEPGPAWACGEALAQWLHENWLGVSARPAAPVVVERDAPAAPAAPGVVRVREPESPQAGRRYPTCPVPPQTLPALPEYGLLVVGGGSSGATAALAAARQQTRTCLVEMNPGLGGTATYGGVHSYWFGRRVGFSAQAMQSVSAVQRRLGLPAPEGAVPKWNIEARIAALTHDLTEAGTDLLLNSFAIGTLTSHDSQGQPLVVRGAVVATPYGPLALPARVTIDASGDGDLSAFAEAETVYGAARDHVAMWYVLANFTRPGRTQNNFTSAVDVGSVEDTTRAILAARRRGEKTLDHGLYIATRESRHVRTEASPTLNDQLHQRQWPDVVSIAFSNHDIKGHSTSDWVRMGLLPPNLEIEIPYRALLPLGLEQILVVGKAFSASHDALVALRMQPDIENLGGAAGLAAAQALNSDRPLRAVDIPTLQRQLVALGSLPEEVLDRTIQDSPPSDAALRGYIDQLTGERPLWQMAEMEMDEVWRGPIPLVEVALAGRRAAPLLREALDQAQQPERRILLAQALALLQDASGLPVLAAELERQLAESGPERLPTRAGNVRYAVRYAPDQGAMPAAARLLYSLGMPADRRALPVFRQVAERVAAAAPEDFQNGMLGLFYYVDALCSGLERLGAPEGIPLLEKIHSSPLFCEQSTPHGDLPNFQADFLLERRAYLELVIARALARCASPRGLRVLIEYLDDARALLAEHAHAELKAITGEDFGKDPAAWSRWLDQHEDSLQPAPWQMPTDPFLP